MNKTLIVNDLNKIKFWFDYCLNCRYGGCGGGEGVQL